MERDNSVLDCNNRVGGGEKGESKRVHKRNGRVYIERDWSKYI
jgi:hypothetical protein